MFDEIAKGVSAVTIGCAFLIHGALAQQPLTADGGFAAGPMKTCGGDLALLNQVSGWQVAWPAQWAAAVKAPDAITKDNIDLWAGVPMALEDAQRTLGESIGGDKMAPRAVIIRVLSQLDGLATALENEDQRYFTEGVGGAFASQWNALLSEKVHPAITDYAAFLRDSYLPHAPEKSTLARLPDNKDCFLNAVETWSSTALTVEELEAIGQRRLKKTETELKADPDFKNQQDYAAILASLRNTTVTTTEAELLAISNAAVDRAQKKVLRAFRPFEMSKPVVEAMPIHMQASFPAGFYRPPQGDAPAAYVINPSRPDERRLMAEVIAFHETSPGHHLYFAYPKTSDGGPFNAGMVEGWAIYAEMLADELELYSSPYFRRGMLAKHLWASSRLIIEPGLHVHGWTRDEAVDFMLDVTALSRSEAALEVDRYLAMPGHSVSYMLGGDIIFELREEAKEVLGDKFDLREFHHVVLDQGIRTLPRLKSDVADWVAEVKGETRE